MAGRRAGTRFAARRWDDDERRAGFAARAAGLRPAVGAVRAAAAVAVAVAAWSAAICAGLRVCPAAIA
jgi:hypothetical protein